MTRPHRTYSREVFGFVRKKYSNGLDPETIKNGVRDVYGLDVPIGTIEDWAPGRSGDQQRRYRKERKSHRREKEYEKSFCAPGLRSGFYWLETGEPYSASRKSATEEKGRNYFRYLPQLERLMPVAISVLGPLTIEELHSIIEKRTGSSFKKPSIVSRVRYLTNAGVLKYDEQTGKYQVNPYSTYARLAARSQTLRNLFKESKI